MKENSFNIVYGIHPINEVIRAKKRKIYELYIEYTKQKSLYEILAKLPSYTKIIPSDKKKLEYLAQSEDHQSIVAKVAPFIYQKTLLNPEKFPLILCCNGIQDTKNLGALLRSAYCTNFSGIIITESRSVDITGSVLKSSAGLAEHLPIYKTKNIIQTIQEAKKHGYLILLADANGKTIDESLFQKPILLIIGNEHQGIDKKLYDFGNVVSLAQKESIISYNASVAGGILMYSIAQRLEQI